MNNTIYRDLHVVNMALKKDSIEKELKKENPWKIKSVANKACQTDIKFSNKSCQTAPHLPRTLSQSIIKHIETQTSYDSYKRTTYYTSSDSDCTDSDCTDSDCTDSDSTDSDSTDSDSIDTIEADEFIILDA